MTQYYSRIDTAFSGDRIFTVPFDYINKKHIEVLLNGVKTSNWTWLNESQINITDANLAPGDLVTIRRNTPLDKKLVEFTNNTILDEKTQNIAQEQALNSIQEIYDNNEQFKVNFKNEVNYKLESVNEAAEKINKLEDAVILTENAAKQAAQSADKAQAASSIAIKAAETANQMLDVDLMRLSQAGEKVLNSKINNVIFHTPFCFNSGVVNEYGESALLKIVEDTQGDITTKTLTLIAPAVYTDGFGATYTINEDLLFDITNLETGEHSIRVVENNGTFNFFAIKDAKVYRSKTPPQTPKIGDLWQDLSIAPHSVKKYSSGNEWILSKEVEAGVLTLAQESEA